MKNLFTNKLFTNKLFAAGVVLSSLALLSACANSSTVPQSSNAPPLGTAQRSNPDASHSPTKIGKGFEQPEDVAVDAHGNVYVVDGALGGFKITPRNKTTPFGPPLQGAESIAVDAKGNVYIADTNLHVVQEVATDGTVSTVVTTGGGYPFGVAVDKDGNVYVSILAEKFILKMTPLSGGWTEGCLMGTYPNCTGSFSGALDLATDNKGNLYVADAGNHRIAKVKPNAKTATTIVKGLSDQQGIAVDGKGDLFYTSNGNVYELKRGKTVMLTPPAKGWKPNGVAVDAKGKTAYVADFNKAVWKIQL
jgi:DNA-binding beta-propeller fold protein YncE